MKKLIPILLLSFVLFSCGPDKEAAKDSSGKTPTKDIELIGAGATFPFPLYSKMFDAYNKIFHVKVNYQAIGSGGGIRQMMNKTVDFGGTDAFMNAKELAKAGAGIVHVPICLGAVAITYNLEGSPELKLSSDLIADIFLGKITKWNDRRIRKLNPGVKLPAMKIVVVHRSDGSGTTFIFSDYLSKVSNEWKEKVGCGKSLNWPVGLGGKGNQGVAGLIQQTPGAIGYAELIYATSNNMPAALIKNKSGAFIKASIESVSLAAQTNLPDDTRVLLTNTSSSDGYPLSSFTWLILYKELDYMNRSQAEAEELLKLVDWMIHDGQKYAAPLHCAPLSREAVVKAERILKSIKYKNKSVI